MRTRFWHGVIVNGKLKVLADVPCHFTGQLAKEAPTLATLTKPAPKPATPKNDDAG